MSLNLNNKTVVITGAGSGIGRAIAVEYAKAGAKVLAVDVVEDRLQALAAELKASGGIVEILKVNVSVEAEVEGMINNVYELWGKLDVLINNAGIMDSFAGVAEMTIETWNRVLAINLNGPMYAIHHAVPRMIAAGGGSIINTASIAGIGGAAAGAAYTVSKHGLVGLTKSTAWMYTQKGLRCNAICPGGVPTEIMGNVKTSEEGYARLAPYLGAMPGLVAPKDIADLALFLGSDLSSSINGTIITCDKGWSAC